MSKLEDLKAKIAELHNHILNPGKTQGMLFDRFTEEQKEAGYKKRYPEWEGFSDDQKNALRNNTQSLLDRNALSIQKLQQEATSLSPIDKMRLAVTSPGLRDLNKAIENRVNPSINQLKESSNDYLSESKIEPGLVDLKHQVANASKPGATGADATKAIEGYMQHLAKVGNADKQQTYLQAQSNLSLTSVIVLNRFDGLEASSNYTPNSAVKALMKSDLKEKVMNAHENSFTVQEDSLVKVFTEAYKNVQACAAKPSPDNDKKMQASLDIMKQFERKDLPPGLISQMEKNLGSAFEFGGLKHAFANVKSLQQELQQRQEQEVKQEVKQEAKQEAEPTPVQNWKAQVAETHARQRRHHNKDPKEEHPKERHHKEKHHKDPTPPKPYDSEVMKEKYRQFTEGKLNQKAEVQQDSGNSMRKR